MKGSDNQFVGVPLSKMNHEEQVRLSSFIINQQWNYSRYWRPFLDRGKKYFDVAVGNILSEEEKTEMRIDAKLIIQIPELIPKIQAMVGMQLNVTKDGQVVARRAGPDAADATVVNELSKEIDRLCEVRDQMSEAFKDAIISSYPQLVWFDTRQTYGMGSELDISKDHWDSTLLDPNWTRNDLRDCRDIIRVRVMTKESILARWPERKKEIEASVTTNGLGEQYWDSGMFTSDERDVLFNSMKAATEMYNRTGGIYVFERYYFSNMKQEVWLSPYSEEPTILPASWDDARRQQWSQLHPEYRPIVMEVPCLYMSSTTQNGVMLAHGKHWWQGGSFPCEVYVPMWLNNKPRGMIEFMADNLKLGCVADIEYLHSVRLANNNLMVTKKGAIVNAEDAASERSRPGGHLVVDEMHTIADAVQFPHNNREQTAFFDIKQMTMATNDRLSVDRNFEGGSQSSQESAKAIQARVQQGQNKQTPYMNAFNSFFMRVQRKKVQMLPYVYTEPMVLRYMKNPLGEMNEVELNEPVEYDWMGNVVRVANNLDGAKYDYIETFGDNSISGREAEMNQFVEIVRNILPTLPQEQWSMILLTIPNRYANEFGSKLVQQEEAMAVKRPGEPMKMSLSVKGEDLLYNPLVIDILKREGVLPPEAEAQQAAPPANVSVSAEVPQPA